MESIQNKFAKTFIYLQNLFFLLFDGYHSEPEAIGKKVGAILQDTVQQVFPDRKGFNGVLTKVRNEWFTLFKKGLYKSLKNERKI